MAKNNFIQYELWKDCKNHCNFCFNRGQPDIDKIESLNFVLEKLNDECDFDYFNEVGFIGGEFFDDQLNNPEVKDLFYELFDKCKELIYLGKVNKVYFTTSLIYDPQKYLIPFLDYLKTIGIMGYCLLCTSYDLKYRFHSDSDKVLWEENMKMLHERYPELKVHTETIVTGFFMQAVIDGTFDILDFCEKFHTNVDYIEPGSGFYYFDKKACAKDLPDFFPTKDQAIKFIKKTMIDNKILDQSTFLSSEIRSDKIYNIYNGRRVVMCGRRKSNMTITLKDLDVKYELGLLDEDCKIIDLVRQMV